MSELTEYCDEELQCVERVIGQLNKQRRAGQCDSMMGSTIDHLIEEVLFLRACLTMHPPYRATISRTNGS